MTDRRGLLGGMVAGLGACATPRLARPGAYPWPLAVQTWSVDAEMKADPAIALAGLARLGFRAVETAGLHGLGAARLRTLLDRAGLAATSIHWSMAELIDDPAGRIADARALGANWLVASAPRPSRRLAPGDWIAAMGAAMTADDWRANAAAMNRVAALARRSGLGFAYHNHPFEFAPVDGRRGFDILLADTDPALVKIELDVAWATAGGMDPAALIRANRDRVRLLHVKGLRSRPAPGGYGPDFRTGIVGADTAIDWRAVIAAARSAGVTHAFVEQEGPFTISVWTMLERSRDYLRAL